MTTTTRTVFVTVATPVKGETYRVTVTGKDGGETFTGTYRGAASTGLRFKVDGKVVTRSTAKIVKIEAEETHEVPADVAPGAEWFGAEDGEDTTDAEVAPGAEWFPEIEAETVPIGQVMDVAAELYAAEVKAGEATAPADESNEDAPADVYDADPMVEGKRLSEMTFAEVMVLAKKYKTPGRGVARIGALREGVAKAIAAEAGRLAGATA